MVDAIGISMLFGLGGQFTSHAPAFGVWLTLRLSVGVILVRRHLLTGSLHKSHLRALRVTT